MPPNDDNDDGDFDHDGVIVRTGKVVSGVCPGARNFGVRGEEQAKDAMLDKKSTHSLFHLTYPSKGASFGPTSKKGNFEDLAQYVGIAWDPKDENAINAICDTSENGIFVWPKEHLDHLKADRWNGMTMTQKQLNMVGYLIEIFYDLCLAPGDNVSMNPGFERYLLDFSRDKDI